MAHSYGGIVTATLATDRCMLCGALCTCVDVIPSSCSTVFRGRAQCWLVACILRVKAMRRRPNMVSSEFRGVFVQSARCRSACGGSRSRTRCIRQRPAMPCASGCALYVMHLPRCVACMTEERSACFFSIDSLWWRLVSPHCRSARIRCSLSTCVTVHPYWSNERNPASKVFISVHPSPLHSCAATG